MSDSATALLSRVAHEASLVRPLLPTYLHLLVSAVFPIYSAAHASLGRPPSAAPAKKDKSAKNSTEEDEEDNSLKVESLSPTDALLFPVFAGCTLVGLYFLLKWLQDPAWLNWALGLYFSQIGLFFATKFLKDSLSIVRSVMLPTQYSYHGKLFRVSPKDSAFVVKEDVDSPIRRASPLPGAVGSISLPNRLSTSIWKLRVLVYAKTRMTFDIAGIFKFTCPIDVLDVISVSAASALVYYHTFIDKPWFLTNFLGFSFCYGSLQIMSPGTSWTGTLLLCALFLYDIYFVFFTPVMVTVATSLDVPIKLLFPRPDGCILPVGAEAESKAMEEYLQCLAKKRTMAMLGLGDIVIPGMMLAFALRFDLYLFYLGKARASTVRSADATAKPSYVSATGSWGERLWTSRLHYDPALQARYFPKPYFQATVAGYILGMVVTLLAMQISQHAQPALLYLVPGVLTSLWGTALFRVIFSAYGNTVNFQKKHKINKCNRRLSRQKPRRDQALKQYLREMTTSVAKLLR